MLIVSFLERPERVVISIVIVIVMVKTGQGYLCERVEDEVAKGEDVQGWSIAVSLIQSLWRHVH